MGNLKEPNNENKKTIVMALAALAVMVGWAGESAEFRLDTMDGTRTVRAVETIAYSTALNNIVAGKTPFNSKPDQYMDMVNGLSVRVCHI